MNGYVYVISSKKRDWRYIGSTKDLKKRFLQHNSGKVKSTKHYRPFELMYYEAYLEYSIARRREVELKRSGQRKEVLFERLGIN